MPDIFYSLSRPTVKKVRDIITWADKNGLRTDIDVLDCSMSHMRKRSDKPLSEALAVLDRGSAGFLRVILRKQANPFLILSDKGGVMDWLEVFVRNINIGSEEYFIFIYMDPRHLDYFINRYDFVQLK